MRAITVSFDLGRLCAFIGVSFLSLNACGAEQSSLSDIGDRDCAGVTSIPVLFVHGSGLTSASWAPMMREFRDRAYPPEFLLAVDMIPRDGDNVIAAKRFIAPGVQQLLRQSADFASATGCSGSAAGKVDIIAHSMGAVSARWYVAKVSPEHVRTLVTIAGANHGTNALCGSSGRGDQQLCPAFAADNTTDRLQIVLNGSTDFPADETPYGTGEDRDARVRIAPTTQNRIDYFTIRRDPDRWIVPPESALLDGAGGRSVDSAGFDSIRETSPGNYLYTGAASHDALPETAALAEFIVELLN